MKRVANRIINKVRSMLESEMKRKIDNDDVPKDILFHMSGHWEELSATCHGNPRYHGNYGFGPP